MSSLTECALPVKTHNAEHLLPLYKGKGKVVPVLQLITTP
jgi:hypothetical protein